MAVFVAVRCSCAGFAPWVVALDGFFNELVNLSSLGGGGGLAMPFLEHLFLELLCIRLLVLPTHRRPHWSSVVANGVPTGFRTMVPRPVGAPRRPTNITNWEPSTSVRIPPPFLRRSRGLGAIAKMQRQPHRQRRRPCVRCVRCFSRVRAVPNGRERRKIRSPVSPVP